MDSSWSHHVEIDQSDGKDVAWPCYCTYRLVLCSRVSSATRPIVAPRSAGTTAGLEDGWFVHSPDPTVLPSISRSEAEIQVPAGTVAYNLTGKGFTSLSAKDQPERTFSGFRVPPAPTWCCQKFPTRHHHTEDGTRGLTPLTINSGSISCTALLLTLTTA